jgi:hypothetical protein
MSAANAAARKRRAPVETPQQIRSAPQQTQTPPATGLTLPQVIAVIDTRLTQLEKFAKEQQSNNIQTSSPANDLQITNNDVFLQELEGRFEVLVEEIQNLKDMLLKLQSYTMDVNKTLMEERVRIFSDLGEPGQTVGTNTDVVSSSASTNQTFTLSSMDLRELVKEEFNKTEATEDA